MSLVLGSGDPNIRDQYLELGSGKPKTRYRLKHKYDFFRLEGLEHSKI